MHDDRQHLRDALLALLAQYDGMRNLLLLAAAAAIPLPEHEADAFVSATFEGVAVAVPRFADLGASQSYAAFLASLGIGGVAALIYRQANAPMLQTFMTDAATDDLRATREQQTAKLHELLRDAAPAIDDWAAKAEAACGTLDLRCKSIRAAARSEHTRLRNKLRDDAAALAYQALEAARADGTDVLIIDTAGRLQNRSELMDELSKIVRVIRKLDDSAPHDSVIVLDGTVGQNALSQVKAFQAVADVSGLIVTKLDGSAKGGVVIALAETFGLPVHAVGVGEGADDLQPFTAREFANALAGVDEG